MSSFQQIMDMMRNDGSKRVYDGDGNMTNLLDTESLMPVGGGGQSTGLFNTSPRAMPVDMNKEERFSRKVFVGGLPPDIDEGKMKIFFSSRKSIGFVM